MELFSCDRIERSGVSPIVQRAVEFSSTAMSAVLLSRSSQRAADRRVLTTAFFNLRYVPRLPTGRLWFFHALIFSDLRFGGQVARP
jgi:hypothetical protein